MGKKKVSSEFMRKIGKKGARSARKNISHRRRVKFGKMGGRPFNPELRKLMEEEGLTRQAAWYRLNKATGKPRGRPREK